MSRSAHTNFKGFVMPDAVTFASEEAKIEALDKIEETPDNLAEIQRIMDAPVTSTEKPEGAEKPAETPAEDTSAVKLEETPRAEPPKPGEAISIPLSELPEEYRNFDNAGKLLKKIKNQDETIARQTQFIKENLQSRDSGVNDQIEQTRRENEELRRQLQARHDAGLPAPTGDGQRRAAASQSKINDIIKRRSELLQKHADVEDQQFNADFIKEKNTLDGMMLDEMVRLNGALESMSGEVRTASQQANQAISMRSENDEAERSRKAFDDQVKEIQTFTDATDGFKLSKPFMELDKEFADYQKQVASVYWGLSLIHI